MVFHDDSEISRKGVNVVNANLDENMVVLEFSDNPNDDVRFENVTSFSVRTLSSKS